MQETEIQHELCVCVFIKFNLKYEVNYVALIIVMLRERMKKDIYKK